MSIKPAILTTKAIKVKETTSKVHTHYERDTDAKHGYPNKMHNEASCNVHNEFMIGNYLYLICMFVTGKLSSLTVYYPHMIHILNKHPPGSALVHNSFELTVQSMSKVPGKL